MSEDYIEPKGNFRLQAGIGSHASRIYKNGLENNALSLGRVIKIDYKTNTVDFYLISRGGITVNNQDYSNELTARLPMLFGGRNGYGNAYGQLYPIRINDIIVVGFIENLTNNCVVLGRYVDDSISTELSPQDFKSSDFNNVNTYDNTNIMRTVFPSQTYDATDGYGSRIMSLPGKSFLYVNAKVPLYSHGTDDGEEPLDYKDLKSSFSGSNEEIEPIMDKAPEILLCHRGIVDNNGNPDPNKLYFYVSQDGLLRYDKMRTDEDWRTYVELSEDGEFRARRQNDSKIFGTGSDNAEIYLDKDSNVTLSSEDNTVSVTPSGAYYNGREIATIDTDSYYDTLRNNPNMTANYVSELATLKQNQILSLKQVGNISTDQLSSQDASNLVNTYSRISSSHIDLTQKANTYGVSTDSYNSAFNNLTTQIRPVIYADDTPTIDSDNWNSAISNYYDAEYTISTNIFSKLSGSISGATIAYSFAQQRLSDSQEDRTVINPVLAKIASENYISSDQRSSIAKVWANINYVKDDTDSYASYIGVDSSNYDAAYTKLSNYLDSENILSRYTTLYITGSALSGLFSDYYSAEDTIMAAISNANAKTIARYNGDVNDLYTEIDETNRQIALTAVSVKNIDKTMQENQAQLKVMANQITSKVSSSSVSGLLGTTLSTLALGGSNLFSSSTSVKDTYTDSNNQATTVTGALTSDYVVGQGSKEYTVTADQATGAINLNLLFYDSNKNFISGETIAGTKSVSIVGAESPASTVFIRVSVDVSARIMLELGNTATAWEQSYLDAVETNSGLQDAADSAQAKADDEATYANTAQSNESATIVTLTTMTADGVLSDTDKSNINDIISDINDFSETDLNKADIYNVDSTDYSSKLVALRNYVNPIISVVGSTSVNSTEFIGKFNDYYTSRNTMLNSITNIASENAQSAIEAMNNNAEQMLADARNKFSFAQSQIQQLSTEIDLKVSSGDLVSEININSDKMVLTSPEIVFPYSDSGSNGSLTIKSGTISSNYVTKDTNTQVLIDRTGYDQKSLDSNGNLESESKLTDGGLSITKISSGNTTTDTLDINDAYSNSGAVGSFANSYAAGASNSVIREGHTTSIDLVVTQPTTGTAAKDSVIGVVPSWAIPTRTTNIIGYAYDVVAGTTLAAGTVFTSYPILCYVDTSGNIKLTHAIKPGTPILITTNYPSIDI